MMNVRLSNDKIYKGSLLLVNAQYPIHDFEEDRMIPVTEEANEIRLKREAVYILRLLCERIHCLDSIVPVSAYRSAREQTEIYETSLQDNGEEFTRKFVALPYHSEHQTGLAIDLGLKKEEMDFIRPDFPYEGICHRFRKAAPHYGFIERYPKGREQVTGIAHEPWHFRYVGYPHSRIMTEENFALEEYVEWMKGYREDCRYVFGCADGCDIEIFYVPADRDEVSVSLPEHVKYQVSGNNADGFIVTVWRA